MKVLVLLFLTFLQSVQSQTNVTNISGATISFMHHLAIVPALLRIQYNAPLIMRMSLIREFSKKNIGIRALELNEEDFEMSKNHGPFFLIIDQNVEQIIGKVIKNLTIEQNVFFLSEKSMEFFEAYTVNDKEIKRLIGSFQENQFHSFEGKHLLERRANFYGQEFKVMTEHEPPYIYIKKRHDNHYDPQIEAFEVTKITSGSYFDLLKSLEISLNFTTRLYKRKDGVWGVPKIHPNGTVENYGMLKNLVEKSADLIVASILITPQRSMAIDYFQILAYPDGGVFIPTKMQESFSIKQYLTPFTFLALVAGVMIFIIQGLVFNLFQIMTGNKIEIDDIFKTILSFLKPLVGASNPIQEQRLATNAHMMLVFMSMLIGSLLWKHYEASLISSLVVQQVPFHDLESLAKTDFQLTANPIGTGTASVFVQSKEGTVENDVFLNNMDLEYSFNSAEKSINLTLQHAKHAYFSGISFVKAHPVYQNCNLKLVFKTTLPPTSYGVRKKFPFSKIIKKQITKIQETGRFQLLEKRNLVKEPSCPDKNTQEGESLSIQKVALPFFCLLMGFSASLILFVFEVITINKWV